MSTLFRIHQSFQPPTTTQNLGQSVKPLKFGILGAAAIAPNALLTPAESHPEVEVYAVAARDVGRAQAFAEKHGIQKAYGSYQELLNDEEVDVVYNPLPNSLHYEWTMKALAAGKHVLNEKPSADTAEETAAMFDFASSKNLILLDAYHYRFHPALLRVKEIVDSGEIGEVKRVEARMLIPKGIVGEGDIRYVYELGGGALMDLGCYTMNCIQYLSSSIPTSVTDASYEGYRPSDAPAAYVPDVDRKAIATLALNNGATGQLTVDLSAPPTCGILPNFSISAKAEGSIGSIEMSNFAMPSLLHSITVKIKGGHSRTEKVYKPKEGKGEEWWTTYQHQLESLVDKIRGREPKVWLRKEESVATMEWIERIYEKTGLGSRPKSTYSDHLSI